MAKQSFHNRKEIRIPGKWEVLLFLLDQPAEEGMSGIVTDLSRNGLHIKPSHHLEKGTCLKVMLKLPEEDEPLEFTGKITRETATGVGIKIETIGETEKKQLLDFFHLSHLYGWFC